MPPPLSAELRGLTARHGTRASGRTTTVQVPVPARMRIHGEVEEARNDAKAIAITLTRAIAADRRGGCEHRAHCVVDHTLREK
jgi:hypothetical protein